MNASEPNKKTKRARLIGNQRMEEVLQSERAGALKGCAHFLGIAAVSLGAVLIFLDG